MENMEFYHKRSPLEFPTPPSKKEIRDGWEVVLEYQDQGNGPFLIDLSHIPKWDVQDAHLAHIRPMDVAIPKRPGDCILERGLLINRMNATQAVIWHLLKEHPGIPQEFAYTDVSDGYALMAVLAKDVFSIMEKVTPLDLSTPSKAPPFLASGAGIARALPNRGVGRKRRGYGDVDRLCKRICSVHVQSLFGCVF